MDVGKGNSSKPTEKMFNLKKWNAVAMWSWDVECDTCAICRVQVMGRFYVIYLLTKFHFVAVSVIHRRIHVYVTGNTFI